MKILYIHQYFNKPSMIGSTRSYEIAKKLLLDGHHITIITTNRDQKNKKIKREKFQGINIIWIPVEYSNKFNYIKRLSSFAKFSIKATYYSLFIEAKVVIATSTPLTVFIPAIFFSIIKRAKIIFEVRDLWPDIPIALGVIKNKFLGKLLKTYEMLIYKFSHTLIVLSPTMKSRLIQQGVDYKKIATIPNFSNIELFRNFRKESSIKIFEYCKRNNMPILLYAGTFGLVNGLNYLIDLAAQLLLINSNVKVILVGDGSEKDFLIKKSKANSTFKKNVFFINSVSKKEIPTLCAYSRMMVSTVKKVPELNANSANKFFDALASGKPILINHSGWLEELINKYKCGYSTLDKPIFEVAKDLNCLLNDKDRILTISSNSTKLAKLHFDIDKLTSQFSNLIKEIAIQGNSSPEEIAPGNY